VANDSVPVQQPQSEACSRLASSNGHHVPHSLNSLPEGPPPSCNPELHSVNMHTSSSLASTPLSSPSVPHQAYYNDQHNWGPPVHAPSAPLPPALGSQQYLHPSHSSHAMPFPGTQQNAHYHTATTAYPSMRPYSAQKQEYQLVFSNQPPGGAMVQGSMFPQQSPPQQAFVSIPPAYNQHNWGGHGYNLNGESMDRNGTSAN
jgi:hypothetical protein